MDQEIALRERFGHSITTSVSLLTWLIIFLQIKSIDHVSKLTVTGD
jgi:hypothetical protein